MRDSRGKAVAFNDTCAENYQFQCMCEYDEAIIIFLGEHWHTLLLLKKINFRIFIFIY